MKQKLMSRKLWVGIAGLATGISLIVSGNVIPGTVTVITSILGYLAAEGYIDAKSAQTIEEIVDEVTDVIEEKTAE